MELAFFNSIITISVKIIEKLTIIPFIYCTIILDIPYIQKGQIGYFINKAHFHQCYLTINNWMADCKSCDGSAYI
jgi:hypothetical protein